MKIVYAGDRKLSVDILDFLHKNNVKIEALCVSKGKNATHAKELISRCDYLPDKLIIQGKKFRDPEGLAILSELNPDYIIGIHFPYIVPKEVLEIPKIGVINLHPALLPFNRGWHTPSWAILDNTPYGATLHFMDEGVDTGDILHQKEIKVLINDTANTLYQKALQAEYEVFTEYWPKIAANHIQRKKQNINDGTAHKPEDLLTQVVQQFSLDSSFVAKDFIDKLRALTTSNIHESAYFIYNNIKYHIQVNIHESE